MSIDRYIDTLALSPLPFSPVPFSLAPDLGVPFYKPVGAEFRTVPPSVPVTLSRGSERVVGFAHTGGVMGEEGNGSAPLQALPDTVTAAINTNALLSFVAGVSPAERDDVLYSVQLAARGASGSFDRFTQTQSWYQKYTEILQNLGWTLQQFAFVRHEQEAGQLHMDQEALAVIAAIASQNQLAILKEAIDALKKLANDDDTVHLFDLQSSSQMSGNFQIGAVQRADNGALSLALGAFHFRSKDTRKRVLFFSWGAQNVHFWTGAQKLTLNTDFYAPFRDMVRQKLGADACDYIRALKLRKPSSR